VKLIVFSVLIEVPEGEREGGKREKKGEKRRR